MRFLKNKKLAKMKTRFPSVGFDESECSTSVSVTTIKWQSIDFSPKIIGTLNCIELNITMIVNGSRIGKNANANVSMSKVKCRRNILGKVFGMVEVLLVRNSDGRWAIDNKLKVLIEIHKRKVLPVNRLECYHNGLFSQSLCLYILVPKENWTNKLQFTG